VQKADFSYRGGANHLSANDCRIIYELSSCNDIADKLSSLKQDYEDKYRDVSIKYHNMDRRIVGDKVRSEINNVMDEYMKKIQELYETSY